MNLNEFKSSSIGIRIADELGRIQAKYPHYQYLSSDMLSAIFYSSICITDSSALNGTDIEKKLVHFVRDYDEILKHFMLKYFGITEATYLKWSSKMFNSTNTLALGDPTGLLTPTNKYNKNRIH